jgi:hypothetical protein
MQESTHSSMVRAVFPRGNDSFAVVCAGPVDRSTVDKCYFRFGRGRSIIDVENDPDTPDRLIIRATPIDSFMIDEMIIQRILLADGNAESNVTTPRFTGAAYNALQLKVPHFAADFPCRSTLHGVHVSVACCGGCNGGMQRWDARTWSFRTQTSSLRRFHRHLVQSFRRLIDPYNRWQRILCVVIPTFGSVIETRPTTPEA